MKIPRKVMDEEIKKYPIYILNAAGRLFPLVLIKSTKDYDHSKFQLHHYIPYNEYEPNKEWYEERGIQQKLILMRIETHEQLHFIAVENMTDEEFKKHYRVSRWALIFNKKHSEYAERK